MYRPVLDGNKRSQVRRDRTCGAWWFCSFYCHKKMHGLGPDAPDLDEITYECENGLRT